MAESGWPSVTAVVPTRNRPDWLRRAVEAILAQDYPGSISVTIVVDQPDPDVVQPHFDDPRVSMTSNERKPGLCGARNTGTVGSNADLIAFCDDDDAWLPSKLRKQVDALQAAPDAALSTTSIVIDVQGQRRVRLAGHTPVTHEDLCRTRMPMLHSSSVLAWRSRLLGDVGLQDETIPGHGTEDWDLMLRASARAPIAHVDEPLVDVKWWTESFYTFDWARRIADLEWILDHHADVVSNPIGSARVYGQLAFSHACLGHRRESMRWARRSLGRSLREPRGPMAAVVCAGLPPRLILKPLQRTGHGI